MNTLYTRRCYFVYRVFFLPLLFCVQSVHFVVVTLCTECSFCRCYFVYRVFFLSLLFCVQSVLFVVVILCTECSFCRCYFLYRVFFLPLLFYVHSVHFVVVNLQKKSLCTQNNNDKMNTLYTK
jgi:hypothetical protein